LARAFMDDGRLTRDEINAAFSTTDKNAVTVQDAAVETRRKRSKTA
jgi:hypothetical protein